MKKTKIIIAILLLGMMVPLFAACALINGVSTALDVVEFAENMIPAQSEEIDGVRYTPDGSIASSKSFSASGIDTAKESREIVILSTVNDKPVVKVEEKAFYEWSSLTTITLPNTIREIGEDAFYGCSQLLLIYFEGTEKEWDAIEGKGAIPKRVSVRCADGHILTWG